MPNATTRLETDLHRLGITALVDDVVNSARVGAAKPDPRIYRVAAELADVPAARCLFVDDTADIAARSDFRCRRGRPRPRHLVEVQQRILRQHFRKQVPLL